MRKNRVPTRHFPFPSRGHESAMIEAFLMKLRARDDISAEEERALRSAIGEVRVLPQPKHPEYGKYVLTPRESRALFRQKGWQRVVAFQTRNPLHRAHEYALVAGLERLIGQGHHAGAVLNPLVGETKGDDVDAVTRMRTYQALIEAKALGQGDKDEALWKKTEKAMSDLNWAAR